MNLLLWLGILLLDEDEDVPEVPLLVEQSKFDEWLCEYEYRIILAGIVFWVFVFGVGVFIGRLPFIR